MRVLLLAVFGAMFPLGSQKPAPMPNCEHRSSAAPAFFFFFGLVANIPRCNRSRSAHQDCPLRAMSGHWLFAEWIERDQPDFTTGRGRPRTAAGRQHRWRVSFGSTSAAEASSTPCPRPATRSASASRVRRSWREALFLQPGPPLGCAFVSKIMNFCPLPGNPSVVP